MNDKRLIVVMAHYKSSSFNENYTVYCLIDNGKYYYFSDNYALEVSERKLFEIKPYLLFYKRI